MTETKPWWTSKTVWGSVVVLLAAIAGLFGYQIDPEMQTQATQQLTAIVAAVGALISLYGRAKATKRLGK